MSAQSDAEQAIRDLFRMLSQADAVPGEPGMVALDKRRLTDKLNHLTTCVSELFNAYELTALGKERARREQERAVAAQEKQTKKQAEQVYAASILFTDKALARTDRLIETQKEQMEAVFHRFLDELYTQQESLKRNRLELKNELQSMEDTELYLNAIALAEKKIQSDQEDAPPEVVYEQPEIKVNEAYIPRTPEVHIEDAPKAAPLPAEEVGADLDLEYFKWSEEGEDS